MGLESVVAVRSATVDLLQILSSPSQRIRNIGLHAGLHSAPQVNFRSEFFWSVILRNLIPFAATVTCCEFPTCKSAAYPPRVNVPPPLREIVFLRTWLSVILVTLQTARTFKNQRVKMTAMMTGQMHRNQGLIAEGWEAGTTSPWMILQISFMPLVLYVGFVLILLYLLLVDSCFAHFSGVGLVPLLHIVIVQSWYQCYNKLCRWPFYNWRAKYSSLYISIFIGCNILM